MIADSTAPRAIVRPSLSLSLAAAGLLSALLIGVLIARDTGLGVAAVIGACYAPIVFVNLPLGIAIWAPLAFFERVPLAGPGPTVILILIAAAWLGALPSMQHHVATVFRRHGALFGLMFAFFAWTTASIVWASDSAAAVDDFWIWIVAGGVFVVVATSIATPRIALALCGAFVVGAVASEVVALLQGPVSEADLATQEAGRLGAGGQDPNYLAAGLVPAAAIAVGLLPFARSGLMRWALTGSVVMLVVGVIATGSRGGLVALTIVIVAALVIGRGRRLQLGFVIAVIIAVGSFWFSTSSLDRIKDFDTGTGRIDLWRVASQMSVDNPILGVGINNFRAESVAYALQPAPVEGVGLVASSPLVAHNIYLQQLAETGAIGFLLLAGFLIAALRASWTAARMFDAAGETRYAGLARALLVGQIGALSASMFISNGNDRRLWLLLAIGVVLASVASRASAGRPA